MAHFCSRRVIRIITALVMAVSFHDHAVAAQAAASKTWDAFTNDFMEATFEARPNYAVWAGRHEFDGRLPDWSAAGIRKEIERLRAARKRAAGFTDSRLSVSQRFERDYVIAVIDDDLFWWATAEAPFRNPTFYSWGLDPLGLHCPRVRTSAAANESLRRLREGGSSGGRADSQQLTYAASAQLHSDRPHQCRRACFVL